MKKLTLLTLSLAILSGCTGGPLARNVQVNNPNNHGSVKYQTMNEAQNTRPITFVDEAKRHPNPSFDIKMSNEKLEKILSDGREHAICVLFKDEYKIRLSQKDPSTKFSPENLDLSSVNEDALRSIRDIFSKFDIASVTGKYPDGRRTQQEMDEDEAKYEKLSPGSDIPNDGSWAYLSLNKYSKESALELLNELNNNPAVRTAEPNIYAIPAAPEYMPTPAEPYLPTTGTGWEQRDANSNRTVQIPSTGPESIAQTWWLNRHSFIKAWQWTPTKGQGARVAVIDTSFQTDAGASDDVNYNQTLKRSFWINWLGQVKDDNNAKPDSGFSVEQKYHGSTVANLIGGKDNNNKGACGGAPNVDLVPIKCELDSRAIASAISYAISNGCYVINLSLVPDYNKSGIKTWEENTDVRNMLNNARLAYCTTVLAAGNTNTYIPLNNSIYTGALMVGATNYLQEFWKDSAGAGTNGGPRVDIAAAGSWVTAGSVDDTGTVFRVRNVSGTSYAAPLVTSAVAILQYYFQSPTLIRDHIVFTADIARGYNSTFNETREMAYGHNGNDGILKIRVLNAKSAVRVAGNYKASLPAQIYRPAATDTATVEDNSGILTSAYRENLYFPSTIPKTLYFWVKNDPGRKPASALSIFKSRYAWGYDAWGAPELLSADGLQVCQPFNPNATLTSQFWNGVGFAIN